MKEERGDGERVNRQLGKRKREMWREEGESGKGRLE